MKTFQIGSFDAKTHLSELLQKVLRGQVYVITRRGKPLAELRPVKMRPKTPRFGRWKGQIRIAPDFDRLKLACLEFSYQSAKDELFEANYSVKELTEIKNSKFWAIKEGIKKYMFWR